MSANSTRWWELCNVESWRCREDNKKYETGRRKTIRMTSSSDIKVLSFPFGSDIPFQVSHNC